MSNYENKGNRWVAVFVRKKVGAEILMERAPFDYVRFNVDDNPDAPEEVVPLGQHNVPETGTKPDGSRLYEEVRVVDSLPHRPSSGGKIYFGNVT